MRTLRITLAYDGTDFVGWQRQAEGASVQGALEEALARFDGEPVTVVGAGRTDAGVHASAQVASAAVRTRHDGLTIARALNATLPVGIRVLDVADAASGFHARFSARSKEYDYRILNGPVVPPFATRWTWHVPWALDVDAMRDAAARLVGEHDFAAFQSVGSEVKGTVRTLSRSALVEVAMDDDESPSPSGAQRADGARRAPPGLTPRVSVPGRLLVYVVEGNGFLRHMVRAIAGTLVEVGSRRVQPALVTELLERPSRVRAGPTAPAAGLCLAAVHYLPREVATQR